MYQGYKIVSKGYNTIKDISEGNFDLHKTFQPPADTAKAPSRRRILRAYAVRKSSIQLSILYALGQFQRGATALSEPIITQRQRLYKS